MTKQLLESLDSTSINISISDGKVSFLADNIQTHSYSLCSSFNMTFDSPIASYLGQPIEVYLIQKQLTTALVDGGIETKKTAVVTLFQDDPLNCAFGVVNPYYFMSQQQFCLLTTPKSLVAQVLKERKQQTQLGGSNQQEDSTVPAK